MLEGGIGKQRGYRINAVTSNLRMLAQCDVTRPKYMQCLPYVAIVIANNLESCNLKPDHTGLKKKGITARIASQPDRRFKQIRSSATSAFNVVTPLFVACQFAEFNPIAVTCVWSCIIARCAWASV